MRWVRGILVVALCYCVAGQTFLVQAAGIAAVTADAGAFLCHGDRDGTPPVSGDDPLAKCHFCWLPASGVALLPAAQCSIAERIAIAASGYSVVSQSIVVVKPPPRGASRAPPAYPA